VEWNRNSEKTAMKLETGYYSFAQWFSLYIAWQNSVVHTEFPELVGFWDEWHLTYLSCKFVEKTFFKISDSSWCLFDLSKFIHLPSISCMKKETIVKTKYVNIRDSSSIIMTLLIGVTNYCVGITRYEGFSRVLFVYSHCQQIVIKL